jgi:hypothetical protein
VLIPGADSNQIASTGITLNGGEIGCFGNPCSVGFPDLVSGQTGRSKTILGQWRYPPYCSPSSLTKSLSMIAKRNFRYLQTRELSFLTINCKMESQKHATRFDVRYDIYSGLWCHKPLEELGFECDFVKLRRALTLRGVFVGSREMFEAMNRAIVLHRLHPVIDRVFPFEDTRAAFHHLQGASHLGKVVVAIA